MTVRTPYGLPSTVRTLDANAYGLPSLPTLPLVLVRASNSSAPPVEQLASIVLDAVRAQSSPAERAA